MLRDIEKKKVGASLTGEEGNGGEMFVRVLVPRRALFFSRRVDLEGTLRTRLTRELFDVALRVDLARRRFAVGMPRKVVEK